MERGWTVYRCWSVEKDVDSEEILYKSRINLYHPGNTFPQFFSTRRGKKERKWQIVSRGPSQKRTMDEKKDTDQ